MVVFRWMIGSLAALTLVMMVLSFILGSSVKSYIWQRRATMFRHYLWILALLWFNTEVWGRVVWTLITWNRPGS